MNTRPNKHGFTGIRKKNGERLRPYYARYTIASDKFLYSKSFPTAEEAAAEYQRMKNAKNSAQTTG